MSETPERPDLPPLRVEGMCFHAVMQLPAQLEVYDFSAGYDPERLRSSDYGVGRYDERRPGMYTGEAYEADRRDIHVGVDLAAPPGDAIYAFWAGEVFKLGDNAKAWDYGPTIITRHSWLDQVVYALHGHLSRDSLRCWAEGDRFEAGAPLARIGPQEENGGWNPHLHFQLSLLEPNTHDLPGVVSEADRAWARRAYPDPRLVLGPLY
jgi:peptidoglycan LD-endopeptidase LytH